MKKLEYLQVRCNKWGGKCIENSSDADQVFSSPPCISQAVIKESMRIIPPGPFAARLVEKDITVTTEDGASYTVPKDSTLLIPISVIQINEK